MAAMRMAKAPAIITTCWTARPGMHWTAIMI